MNKLVLIIGDKNYSSWSLRAWLLLKWLGADFEEKLIRLYREGSRAATRPYCPTAMVPALIDGDIRVWDTFGIILHMAERYPEVWPADRQKRAFVQSICAEMHADFRALRSAMPHDGRGRNRRVPITPAIQSDIDESKPFGTRDATASSMTVRGSPENSARLTQCLPPSLHASAPTA